MPLPLPAPHTSAPTFQSGLWLLTLITFPLTLQWDDTMLFFKALGLPTQDKPLYTELPPQPHSAFFLKDLFI